MFRVLVLLLGLLAVMAALISVGAFPPAWNPFAPLDVSAPLNPVNPIKLRELLNSPTLCQEALETSGLDATPVPDSHPAPGCGLNDAVRVTGGVIALAPPTFLASCPLAVDWALFERQILEPLVLSSFHSPVARVGDLGSYNCRNIREGESRSAHATANALDLASIRLRDGREIKISEWKHPGAESTFLHSLRNQACRVFGVVLSPDFNPDHWNHIHLQATGWGFCR